MALDLNALAGKTAITNVSFMGQTALIHYNPSVLTASALTKAQSGGDDAFVEVFVDLVKDWDVKRGTKKVPLTKAGLSSVPITLLKAIFKGIATDGGSGSEEEGKTSSAG